MAEKRTKLYDSQQSNMRSHKGLICGSCLWERPRRILFSGKRRSDSVSRLVALSKIKIGGFFKNARAIANIEEKRA